MPIYEYQALKPENACPKCRDAFEVIQGTKEEPLTVCPRCGQRVKKIISWCRAAIMETPDEHIKVAGAIKGYEDSGMWSHAAELADKYSEKTKDKALKARALDNYKKAGYNPKDTSGGLNTDND